MKLNLEHPVHSVKTQCGNVSITQILCEIKIRESRVTQSAILTNTEALNFHFHEVLHFLKAENYQVKNQSPLKSQKRQF